jgi:hypothetical protein
MDKSDRSVVISDSMIVSSRLENIPGAEALRLHV